MTKFAEMYAARVAAGKLICVGLDPDLSKIPDCTPGGTNAECVFNYMVGIVEGTHHVAAAYKPQSAFFEALGKHGAWVLPALVHYIREVDPTIPIILDYKRGDIGNTNAGYVDAAFSKMDVDAVTIHPYLGMEANRPFLNCTDKLIIVLCRTSNGGAGELQDVRTLPIRSIATGKVYSTMEFAKEFGNDEGPFEDAEPMPLYQFVAHRVAENWNAAGNCAVVVGATYPAELGEVRAIVGDMLILLPGFGAQGAQVADVFPVGIDSNGWGVTLNSAGAINFAYLRIKLDGVLKYTPEQFVEAATEAAEAMNKEARAAKAALVA